MQYELAGTVADMTKAALVAVHRLAGTAAAAAQIAAAAAAQEPQGTAGGSCVVLAWGANIVIRAPEGRVYALAAAVRQGLAALRVGKRQLAVAARCTAGRSLHFLSQHATL